MPICCCLALATWIPFIFTDFKEHSLLTEFSTLMCGFQKIATTEHYLDSRIPSSMCDSKP